VTTTVLPEGRHVEQVMGLPVTLALRGRHARGPRAEDAWARVLAVLRRADEVFSTYRADSAVSRLDAGTTTLADCPP
jgi:thiamine biosynthesis lipoprotein